MKIGIFTNNYLPNPYGVSTSVETFRCDLEKLGHEVFIFAPEWPGYKDTNPRVFRYPAWDIKIKIRFPLAIPYSWRINKIIKKLDLDIIHAQHPNLLGTAAKKWAKKLKIPLVFTWHTLYDHYTNFVPFLPKKLAAGYMMKKAAKFANNSDAVIVPTDSIIPILRKWGVKQEIIPVSTGVVEEEFVRADREMVRKKYGIKDDDILLLLVSRLTAEKNIFFVVKAVKEIIKKNEKVKLLVVGEGYQSSEIVQIAEKEKIADKVFLSGGAEHGQLKNYYAAGDIFIYGSKSETQGMVISEAMYMGLPIVAVNATGTSSLVLNNGNGFLTEENESEFFEAVWKLVNDKNLREKFSETSSRIATQKFTSQICARKLLGVYEQTIENCH